MIKKLLLVFCIGVAMVVGAIYYTVNYITTRNEQPVTFTLRRGSSTTTLLRDLAKADLVKQPNLLAKIIRIYYRDQLPIKSGEYEIAPHTTLQRLFQMFMQGKMKKYKITIPEGLTTYEIINLLNKDPVLQEEISETVKEGELLPETYVFYRGETRNEIIRRMKAAMQEALMVNWEARQPGLPYHSPTDLLILASIVEKETALNSEIRKVASVFVNRLRINMRLQSCPTVIYAINNGRSSYLGRVLTFDDLKFPSEYNTYTQGGLPPTPITNPGKEAIAAAANPETTNYLFFVVDGKGGHHFTSNFTEHLKYANRYRNSRSNTGMFVE